MAGVTISHNMAQGEYLTVKTRSGSKIHYAHQDGSSTRCGVWLKWPARRLQVKASVTCDKCHKLWEANRSA